MDKAPGVLIANQRVQHSGPAPRLKLLYELEPAHRVFLRNLTDLLFSRPGPRYVTTSRPAPFWDDVFVPSGAPWSSFLESILWHLLVAVLFVWGQSRVWVPEKQFPQRSAFTKPITYYPPPQSYPAVGGRASAVRSRARGKRVPTRQPAIPVTPQQRPRIVTPPDIKQATARLPNILGSHSVTPMVPFSATTGLRRNAPAGSAAAVGPPPQVDQATGRRLALPQASAVAPAPELGGASPGRAMAMPNTGGLRVVPPPPMVQATGNSARAGGLATLPGATSQVVPPPPSVLGAGNPAGTGRLSSLSGTSSQVVPPPPSVQGTGNSPGVGRLSRLGGAQVVPPAPSVQGTGNSGGNARVGSLSGVGSQVVPPPPSVQGAGNSAEGGRLNAMSGNGPQVVPPPPSVAGAGDSAGSGRVNSLSGNGSQVVPPPPSIGGPGDSAGGGRMSSLSAEGSQVAPPPPSVASGGNSAAGAPAVATDPPPVVASSPAPASANQNQPAAEELSLGSIGLVFALPGSSYFSNYEVFVAKRRMADNQIKMIKLVYEFLPYQRRLSEYDFTNLRQRHKLRATQDASCNETLGQMIQSHTDPNLPPTEYPNLPAELRSADLNAMLPCYRTNADDFQRAFSPAH